MYSNYSPDHKVLADFPDSQFNEIDSHRFLFLLLCLTLPPSRFKPPQTSFQPLFQTFPTINLSQRLPDVHFSFTTPSQIVTTFSCSQTPHTVNFASCLSFAVTGLWAVMIAYKQMSTIFIGPRNTWGPMYDYESGCL